MGRRKKSILEEAKNHCEGDRAVSHGDFAMNMRIMGTILMGWLGPQLVDDIKELVTDAALANAISKRILQEFNPDRIPAMACQALKMAREATVPTEREHYADQVGYVNLRYKLRNE